jgi:hypothetical protein
MTKMVLAVIGQPPRLSEGDHQVAGELKRSRRVSRRACPGEASRAGPAVAQRGQPYAFELATSIWRRRLRDA